MYPNDDPRNETLHAQLDDEYRRLASAATLEQYQTIYDTAQLATQAANDTRSAELAFRSWTLMAMAALAVVIDDDINVADKELWLERAYKALVTASAYGVSTFPNDWLFPYAAAVSDLYENNRMRYWSEERQPQIENWNRQLIHATEAFLPIELVDKQNVARTTKIANMLGDFSFRYGTKKAAYARSDFAIANAERMGSLQSRIDALYGRYYFEKNDRYYAGDRLSQATSLDDLDAWLQDLKQANPPGSSLADRRAELRSLAEKYRRSLRSRAGRLWASQYLAQMQREFFRDDLSTDVNEGALFNLIDSMKARLLFDYITAPFEDLSSSKTAAEAAEIEGQILHFKPEPRRDAKDILQHEMRLVSELPIGLMNEEIFEPQSKLRRMQLLDSLEKIFISENAGFSGTVMPSTYERIASALQPDEAMIEYYLPSNRETPRKQDVFIFIVVHGQVYIRQSFLERNPAEEGFAASMSVDGRQPIEASLMGEKIMSLRLAIQEGRDAAANGFLQVLYHVLVAPILELGLKPKDFRRWIIIPHSTLHSIPFTALLSPEGRYLIEDVALVIAPSASIWYELQAAVRPPVSSFVGFANPFLLSAEWPPLPDSELEVEYICTRLNRLACKSFVAEEATESIVPVNVPSKSIVHFATHGDFPENDAIDLHRILLAPTSKSDGRLHAEEIRHMDLRAARLVALSICNGGIYRIGPGDEPYGLISALFAAGAENVMGTLWALDDNFGRMFMVEFYTHLLSEGPAEAYRRSCTKFLRDHRSLRDWAGWVLVGCGRPWKDKKRV